MTRALGFPSDAERAVWKAARERHPEQAIGWTSIVADEPTRVVVTVFHDPPPGRTYAFDKMTGVVAELPG